MQRKTVALQAVRSASDYLKKNFLNVRAGKVKADGTLVSKADTGSEQCLMKILKKSFPDDEFLSEESAEKKGKTGYRWIVDPLDGTHNFLAGIPIFGVLLALEKDGEVVYSICSFPILGELFTAERGKGAYCNGKKIRVSSTSSIKGSVFLADGNSASGFASVVSDIERFHKEGTRFRFLGEGPFCMTRVALGSVVVAILRCGKLWDFAAPTLLIEEAGGKVTDFHGKPLNKEERPLVASNGHVHARALSLLRS